MITGNWDKDIEIVKRETGIKADGLAILFMTSLMGEETLLKVIDKTRTRIQFDEKMYSVIESMGIDIHSVCEGWQPEEKRLFSDLVSLWVAGIKDGADATVLVLMMRHFIVPLCEKKKALEQMVHLLEQTKETNA